MSSSTSSTGEYILHARQHEAIYTHDRNLIVVAGAGSGKTRVLVERFLALLDAHPEWPLSSLVAITFTQKAAREMRDRVRREIETRITRLGATDEAAVGRWRKHQAALDSARIGTIHSLCAAILRANAAEAQIDPGFALLDEVESAIVADDAVEEALSRLVERDLPASRLLIDYTVTQVRDTIRVHLFADEESLPAQDSPLERWRESHARESQGALQAFLGDMALIQALAWSPPAGAWPREDDKLLTIWEAIWAGRRQIEADPGLETVIRVAAEWHTVIKGNVGTTAAWGGKETLEAARQSALAVRSAAARFLAAAGSAIGEADVKAAEMLPRWREAILVAKQVYAEAKQERRALDFTDLEHLTRRLLREHPAVCARYRDAEFKHILVDEFQDTNAAQRDIIYALADADRPGSLFVVGDPKQSIYQFRGADVSVFNAVRRDILARRGHEVALNVSFRTHRMLVDAFNTIFQHVLGATPAYDFEVAFDAPMEAGRGAEGHHAPTFEVLLIDKERANAQGAGNAWHADELRQWEAWELAQRLHAMVGHKLVWDKNAHTYRPLQFGDVAVLFRATTTMRQVEDAFKSAGIPYITYAGKGFYDRPEVWDLLNLLRALYNTADDLSLAAALRSPLFSLSDDDLLALRLAQTATPSDAQADAQSDGQSGAGAGTGAGRPSTPASASLWLAVTASMLTQPVTRFDPAPPNAERVHFAGEVLTRLHRVAGRVPIAELLMRALEATGYLAAQAGLPDGARRVNNVEKLLEIARQSGRIGLGEFTAYLQDLTEREDRESEALVEAENLVRLMTIHASKGLEFPVVALFEANWERRPDKPLLLLDAHQEAACRVLDASGGWAEPVAYRRALHIAEARDRAEGKRLLYVALTRAQDYFIVCGRKEAGDGWLNQMAAALNLPDSIYPDAARQISFDWGAATLGIPLRSPEIGSQSALGDAENTAWEALDAPEALTAVASAASAASRPMTDPPPLLRTPVQDVQAPVRLLDSKELARLGEVRPDFSRFRNQVLHNAPADIRMVTQLAEELGQESGQPVVPGRVIGEIVHRALRFDRLPGNTPALNDILASYAWEHGIAQADAQDQVVKRCHDLLSRIERTWIMGQVRQAEQVYREVPFTFRTSERTINGIIDVLFFTRRQWHVLDYKTSYVALGEARDQIAQTLAAHAERYHQQVGVYAAAVEQKFGQMPQTHIHYVRYAYTVTISPAAGQAALNNLETDIREALQALQD